MACIAQAHPYEVEDEADVAVHQCGRLPGELPELEDSAVSSFFDPFGLEPLEGRLYLGVDEFGCEGATGLAELS